MLTPTRFGLCLHLLRGVFDRFLQHIKLDQLLLILRSQFCPTRKTCEYVQQNDTKSVKYVQQNDTKSVKR